MSTTPVTASELKRMEEKLEALRVLLEKEKADPKAVLGTAWLEGYFTAFRQFAEINRNHGLPAAPPAYVCPKCWRPSWNPNDAANKYCGVCGSEDGSLPK